MKSALCKFVSVCLSLVLLLTIMPMAVFADGGNQVSPCAVGGCEHIYNTIVESVEEQYSVLYHRHIEYEVKTCIFCGFEARTVFSNTLELHTVDVWTFVGREEDKFKYEGNCKFCGQEQTLILDYEPIS